MSAFAALVEEHFRFLVEEYGFSVVNEADRSVTYGTEESCVRITLDRCQISVELRPHRVPIYESAWIDLADVINYKNPSARSRFRYACNPHAYEQDQAGYLRKQLKQLAGLTRRYCDEMLRGDYGLREELERFRREWVKQELGDAIGE